MDLDDYQARAKRTDITSDDDEVFALGLIGEVGSVASALKKARRAKKSASDLNSYRAELKEELGDALWYVAAIASAYNLKLSDIGADNLSKAADYFGPPVSGLLDEQATTDEQLPRLMRVEFDLLNTGRVRITVNGEVAGDDLNSASTVEDNYKYHDIFHFALAAKLGWSPVIRDLLRPKRKRRDENGENIPDDAARARILEEGIAAMLFGPAEVCNWYATPDDIPLRLSELIKRITRDFEVRVRRIPEWQDAICTGFAAFREIEGARRAIVLVDLENRSLKVESVTRP